MNGAIVTHTLLLLGASFRRAGAGAHELLIGLTPTDLQFWPGALVMRD